MLSWAGGKEKEHYGDPWSRRLGFRSPLIEGCFGLSLLPSRGTGLESKAGKGREREKGRDIDDKDVDGSLPVWLTW